jgi:hypothetical protein
MVSFAIVSIPVLLAAAVNATLAGTIIRMMANPLLFCQRICFLAVVVGLKRGEIGIYMHKQLCMYMNISPLTTLTKHAHFSHLHAHFSH